MIRTAWLAALVGLTLAATGLGADPNAPPEGLTEEQMELHERGMEIQARENELAHEEKLRGLEIQEREVEINRMRGGDGGGGAAMFLLWTLVAHILLTVWVCKDMNQQQIARALWVPIILLTGVFGAIVYAIVRHADVQAKPAAGRAAGRRGG